MPGTGASGWRKVSVRPLRMAAMEGARSRVALCSVARPEYPTRVAVAPGLVGVVRRTRGSRRNPRGWSVGLDGSRAAPSSSSSLLVTSSLSRSPVAETERPEGWASTPRLSGCPSELRARPSPSAVLDRRSLLPRFARLPLLSARFGGARSALSAARRSLCVH